MSLMRPELETKVINYYNFFNVMEYIKQEYGYSHRKSFWDWLNEDSMNDVNNGCYVTLCTNPNNFYKYYHITDIEEFNEEYEEVIDVINALWVEYGKNEMTFWVSW